MPTSGTKRPTLTEQNRNLRELLEITTNDHQRVSEALSNAVLMLRQEDVGWAQPGTSGQAYRGLTLKDLYKWSGEIRASLSGTSDKAPNPHMRNGLMLRHSFVWDGGIRYEGIPPKSQGRRSVEDLIEKGNNARRVFGKSARRKREHALYSDGLYLLIGKNSTKELTPVPLHEITDTQRDEYNEDEIVAYRWTRNVAQRVNGRANGALTGDRKPQSVWVYVDWFTGKKPAKIKYGTEGEEDVLRDHTAFDLHANRPDGAAFGSPDAIAALVWARIIRDLIMNGVKMQDALAMFAFKATAKTKAGQQTTALELGETHAAGSAAAMAGDTDFNPLNTAGKGYDFGSIGFVVATMAASLHVSGIALSANTALAGSSYGAAKTLDLPGRMAMETRRAEHVEFDERLLTWMGAPDATAAFDNYDDATDEYRAVQAAYLMWQSGNLSPEAFRAELEDIYGHKFLGSIPADVITPNTKGALKAAAAVAPKTTPAPDQGRGTGGGGDADHAGDLPAPED